jgi:hypothetical protein
MCHINGPFVGEAAGRPPCLLGNTFAGSGHGSPRWSSLVHARAYVPGARGALADHRQMLYDPVEPHLMIE